MTDRDPREPDRRPGRQNRDDVDDLPTPDEHAPEVEAGRDALRELGSPGPVPADVLARLEGRLEGELGRDAPARRARPRRRRLTLLAPGFGIAVAAIVVVAVVSTRGSSSHPTAAPHVTLQANARAMAPEKASTAPAPAPKAAVGAADSAAAAPGAVRVPQLAGRTVAQAARLVQARGLVLLPGCPAGERVTGQRPAAGAHVARGARVTVRTGSCMSFSSP